ncbi:MAG TPA: hypothetical protein VHE13_06965 [Opitutus sp.]|nr:hypothetical protein [Opitutus sp.]
MKSLLSSLRAAGAATVACVGLGLTPTATRAADTAASYDNFVEFSAGGADIRGDKSQYEKIAHQKDAWGGLSGFHYGQDLNKTTTLTLDGRALVGDQDFNLDLKINKEDTGWLDLGFTSYRTWFDGSAGYFPQNGLSLHLYDEELHIDRSDLWVAANLSLPDQLKLDFRYDFTTRKGLKDSSSWADTGLTGGFGSRAIVPTFLRIDEHRHIVKAKLSRDSEQTSWAIDGRYEATSIDNKREIHRAPGEKADRYITHTDGSDSDLFMVHGFVERHFTEQLSMSTAIAHYNIDTNISGSRIYGVSYDPVFDPVYAGRQNHDEGYYDLSGESHMNQTIANLNVLYTPDETWSIVPALRAEKTTWGLQGEYTETAVGSNLAMAQDENESESDKNLRSLTESLDIRWAGVANWVFLLRGERVQSYGTLSEDLIALETGVDTIFRTTDYRDDQTKYVFTANWYCKPGLSFSGQAYWKGRQDSFNNTRDSTPVLNSGDRYPAYIAKQDFETTDFNLRMTWSPVMDLRFVTRYDYQDSTIRTRELGLNMVDTSTSKTHIVSEAATWNPLPRWFVQATGNVVFDQLKTPASDLTGAAAGIVLNSDNNYTSYGLATGYVIDDRTDISANYDNYRANNYVDNGNRSVPYGASSMNQVFGVTLNRRVNAHMNFTLKYAYLDNKDDTSGGMDSYRASFVYGRVQYRF